jgi:hypothetical protein
MCGKDSRHSDSDIFVCHLPVFDLSRCVTSVPSTRYGSDNSISGSSLTEVEKRTLAMLSFRTVQGAALAHYTTGEVLEATVGC